MDAQIAALQDACKWIERRLQSLEYRYTSTRGPTGSVNKNGFAFSAVPEWELRQKLEEYSAALGKLE